MDLRQYFRKIREIQASIPEEYPVVVSLETADGGKAGQMTEVSREMAAKLICEGKAVLASAEEIEAYKKAQIAAKRDAERSELSKRVQVAIIADPDLQGHFPGKKSGK